MSGSNAIADTRSNADTSTTANAIATHDLAVDHATAHGTVRALEATSLAVAGGDGLAVMGPSGCGKSTLLGLLAGLAVPSRGSVTIGTEMISAMSEPERVRFRRRSLGMVYQADNLLPHLTVEENVGLQLAISRPEADPSGAIGSWDPQALLLRLGIAPLAGRMPHQLSGGERQRVAVARAVVHRPQVILADEPTGSLDAKSARIVIELLVEIQAEIGATMVVVTHDPEIAARMPRTVHLQRIAAPTAADGTRPGSGPADAH